MNIKKYFTISLGVALLAATQVSCIHEDNWDAPEITCNNKFDAATMTMADFVALAPAASGNSGAGYKIPDGANDAAVIFDGYVVSSDENGNFYKTISFQDSPVNPTVGLQIEINKSSNYADFPVGAHIRIKANGLIIKKDAGAIKLGMEDPNYSLGRIPQSIVGRFISGVCDGNKMDIVEIVPTELTLAEIGQERYVNTLVKVKNVQFASNEVGLPLMAKDAAGTYQDTNRNIADANGGSAIVRTDGFFRTTSYLIPNNSGDITFVVSKFNNTYQNVIRSTIDIDMKNPRFATGIVGGTNINYLSAFTVDFEGYSVDNALFPEYINYAFIGNRYWQVKNFNSNNYIQMSANAGSGSYQTMFIVPVDFTNANSLAFNVNVGFHTGNALKVYTTTDYVPLTDIGSATLNDITSSFTIPTTPTSGYGTFTPAGTYSIPASLTGNGFVVFKYEGANPGVTTTIQLDNITVN